MGGASPRLRFAEGYVQCADTTFGFRKPSWDLRRLDSELPGDSFSTPEGLPGASPGVPRPPPETARFRGDRWPSVYTSRGGAILDACA